MADGDISLEPLLNQSTEGIGGSRKVAFVPVDLCGAASHRTPLTITDVTQEVVIGTGKRTIEFMDVGDEIIVYGGPGVTFATGIKLFPNQLKPFSNVKDTFSIYFVTDTGKTSTLNIAEFA